MSRVIVDRETIAKLNRIAEATELCDDSGRVVGHFFPVLDPAIYKNQEPQISEDEMNRRERTGGGRSLAAIMADLEKRS
jgi:hypothetical protein